MSRTTLQSNYDVIVVGAGISGIGTAYWLQKKCPDRSFAVLEARNEIGGTWSLFKYPGIRSDSDMFTFGYRFHPWQNPQSLSDGDKILQYLKDTIAEYQLDQYIHFNQRLISADWSDQEKKWRLEVNDDGSTRRIECRFLSICTGYYSYKEAHRPKFPNEEVFSGPKILPQFWPKNLDYSDKEIAVIGSGATAITIVPAMVKNGARKVTMIQRSPTYVMNLPNRNELFIKLKKLFSGNLAYRVTRSINILLSILMFSVSKAFPGYMKRLIMKGAARQLPDGFEVEKHFNPKYNPWDQRLCVVPDGDLFKSISSGQADVVTDTIKQFTPDGIELDSGRKVTADIVVIATGLKISLLGEAVIKKNGQPMDIHQTMIYKGMMVSDVPNFIYAFGYTNASWTLKVDLTANYLCKLLNYMNKKGLEVVTPMLDKDASEEPFLNLSSGYIKRAVTALPKQGKRRPWRVYQNYLIDMMATRWGSLNDGTLEFER